MERLRTREELEDIFQRMVCEMLPKMHPQDIRPTYQQDLKNGKYVTNEFGETEIIPFTPHDNVIYLTVTPNSGTTQSYTTPAGFVRLRQEITLQISCYGEESSELSACVFSLARVEAFRYMLEAQGIYLETMDETIGQIWEIVNEEYMERHDFNIVYNQCVDIANPLMNKVAKTYKTDVEVDKSGV